MKKKITLLLVFAVISTLSFGQLFITELADPNDASTARFVEIFNYGDADVDLGAEGYGLWRYTNDYTDPQTTIWGLTGTVPSKGFYIVVETASIFESTFGFPPDQETVDDGGPADSNGDDKVLLVKVGADTVVIDIYGVPGVDGTGTCAEFEDGRAERVASVTTGNGGTWDEANWNVWSDASDASGCTNHMSDQPVNVPDGIFDPGQWIGYVPSNTIVAFENLTSVIGEDGVSIDVCVTITNPDATNATTVEIDLDGASNAINGTDFSTITFPQTLTFPAGSSDNQCLTFTITDDTDPEADELIILNLQNPAGGSSVELGTQAQHKLLISHSDIICPNVGDLIISEVMQNPSAVSDANGEWFEVHNTTGADIDLLAMEFVDDNYPDEKFSIPSSLIIPAGGYLLFAINGDVATNGGLPAVDFVYPSLLSLANGTDGIQINCSGTVIDAVLWDDGATFPDPNGASMSLMADYMNSVDNDNGANWEEATSAYGNGDLGTPGTSNVAVCELQIGAAVATCDAGTSGVDPYTVSIDFTDGGTSTYVIATTAGTVGGDDPSATASGTISITGIDEGTDITVTIDNSAVGGPCNFIVSIASPICFTPTCGDVGSVIITEIMQNPKKVTDDLGEWFELYNTTASDVDLQGWSIADDLKPFEDEGFTFPNSLIIPAGGYLLMASNGDVATNGGLPTPGYVYEYDRLSLANGEDGIVIQCSGLAIDSVLWDGGVTFPDPNGASMSLKTDFLNSVDNDNGANWEEATSAYGDGDLGTPGAVNMAVCDLQIGTGTATCDAETAGVDTYTAAIDYTVGGTSTYVITTTAGTVGGDDPSATASGTISITGIDEGTDITVTIDNSAVSGSCDFVVNIASPTCGPNSVGLTGVASFTVYPNPVTDGLFTIRFTTEANRSIQIYNVMGSQVYEMSDYNNEQITVTDLEAGIYILNVTEEGRMVSRKLVIQ
ncbi:MAG: lamin tail domain-containing protein [Bacteroidota bacterium]